jgi:hypothetical protein
MKNLVVIFSVFCGTVTFGQITIKNNSLLIPEKQIAYRNFNNQLELTGVNADSSIIVMSRNEKLTRFNTTFAYIPMFPIDSDTLRIFKNREKIGEVVVKLEVLQSPKINFGEVREGVVKQEYLLTNPGLQTSYEPQLAIPDYYVVGCELIIYRDGKKKNSTIIHGNAFSPKQEKMLGKLKAGDVLHFTTALITNFLGDDREIEADVKLTLEL